MPAAGRSGVRVLEGSAVPTRGARRGTPKEASCDAARSSQRSVTAGILALGATACGGDDGDSDSDDGSSGGWRRRDASSDDQGRHGLRHRRPRRPVVQRLGRRRPRRGRQTSSASTSEESEAERRRGRAAREERLRHLADAGYDPVIAVGFAYAEVVGKVAAEYPDTTLRDHRRRPSLEADNVTSLVFAEEQGSFLVGVAAALKTETGHIGFVGGVETPLIQKFEAGYDGRRRRRSTPTSRSTSTVPHAGRRTSPASVTRPRARPPRRACTTRRRHRLPRRRWLRRRCLRGRLRGRRAGHRRRLRPVQRPPTRPAGRHHDLDAQARRHRGLRVPHRGRRRRRPRRRRPSTTSRSTASATPTSGG